MTSKALNRNAVGLRAVLMTTLSIGVVACGSAPTVGDQILAQGKGTAAIGTKWNQGNEMVANGQSLAAKGRQQIKDGQKMITDGQDNIRKGDNMVTRGKASMAEAETQYRAAQTHPQAVVIPSSSPH
jgi:hypothetical protein